jgi:hypothetical protein
VRDATLAVLEKRTLLDLRSGNEKL